MSRAQMRDVFVLQVLHLSRLFLSAELSFGVIQAYSSPKYCTFNFYCSPESKYKRKIILFGIFLQFRINEFEIEQFLLKSIPNRI